jgi:hypothetical protein
MKTLLLLFTLFFSLFGGERPDWVFGKSSDEVYIYGVGYSQKMPSFSLQRVMAESSARTNLSENIKVEIKSIFQKSSGTHIEEQSSYKFIQTSQNSIKFSFVKDKWVDENGNLYILMAMDKSNLEN